MKSEMPGALHGWFRAAGPTLVFLLVLGIWAAVAAIGIFPPLMLPSPFAVFAELWDMLAQGWFLQDIFISVFRQLAGFGAACLVALPLGYYMGVNSGIMRLLTPFLGFFRFLPAASLVPLLIVWLGIGDTQKIALLFIGVFPFLVSAIADEVARVPPAFREAAQTLGNNRREILFRVVIPASASGVFDAMRVMMGIGWTYIVIAELVGASEGIGFRIVEAQRFLNTSRVLAGVLTIGLLGVTQDLIFRGIGWFLFPWRRVSN